MRFCPNCGAALAPGAEPPPLPAHTGAAVVDERWRAAVARNYVTPAVITLILYLVFWLPGLVVNLVYLSHAGQDERASGVAPEGKGCLTALLWVFGILPVGASVLFFMVIVGALGRS